MVTRLPVAEVQAQTTGGPQPPPRALRSDTAASDPPAAPLRLRPPLALTDSPGCSEPRPLGTCVRASRSRRGRSHPLFLWPFRTVPWGRPAFPRCFFFFFFFFLSAGQRIWPLLFTSPLGDRPNSSSLRVPKDGLGWPEPLQRPSASQSHSTYTCD